MKIILLSLFLLIAVEAKANKESSWYYTQWIMSSGVKVSDCSEIKGGYKEFVSKLKSQLKDMSCIESNSQGLKTNVLICPSAEQNGNMISGFWFKNKAECQSKSKEMSSK
jgi:hypothetical protein